MEQSIKISKNEIISFDCKKYFGTDILAIFKLVIKMSYLLVAINHKIQLFWEIIVFNFTKAIYFLLGEGFGIKQGAALC